MKSLEDYIEEQRSKLDDQEPNDGHTDRFNKRIQPNDNRQNPMQMMWWAAAVIIGIVIVTQVAPGEKTHTETIQMATISLSDISPDMADAESYFVDHINRKEVTINTSSSIVRDDLLNQQLEQLESDYENLKLALNKYHGDERIVRYMVENYRLRLLLLETHLERLQKVEHINRLD